MRRTLSKFDQRRVTAALPLRKGVEMGGVLAEVEAATQKFWQDSESEARIQGVDLRDHMLVLTRKHHKPKPNPKTGRPVSAGAPRKEALRTYVTSLVEIYEGATGRRITRVVNPYARGQGEKPHPYLAACMKAAGKAYPTGLVRQVLKARV